MITDPKITDTSLYSYGDSSYGEGLCREQHICSAPFIWDEEWLVIGDQRSRFGEDHAKHFAAQFQRRPKRGRHVIEPSITCNSSINRILEAA
jgi:hypothetical protein